MRNVMMKQYTRSRLARAALGVALTSLLALTACSARQSTPPPGSGQPDKFLYDRGTEALTSKKWLRAREYFRQLVDNYPQSSLRPDAKLALGDTYLGENSVESLILAQSEFREFLTFYPTHPRADYAQYKLGYGHWAQMLGPQRDQTQTKEAIAEFELFLERFPNSPLAPEVRKKLRESRDRLSESEYQVGLFYHRSRWYPGAVDRFKSVLKQDPEYTRRDAVYYYLAESLTRMQMGAEALPYLDRLVKEFEQSEYLERAKKLLDEAKNVQPVKAEIKK